MVAGERFFQRVGLPRFMLPVLLGVGFFFWISGVLMGLASRRLVKDEDGRAFGQLLLADGLTGLVVLTAMGWRHGVFVLVMLLVVVLVWGLLTAMRHGTAQGRRMGVVLAVGAFAAVSLTAVVGTGRVPVLAALGHAPITYFFARWSPSRLAPQPGTAANGPASPAAPLTASAQVPGVTSEEACEKAVEVLQRNRDMLASLQERCRQQQLMPRTSDLCRHQLEEATTAANEAFQACKANGCPVCQ